MIKAIEELKKYHNRMTTVMNELEVLRDYERWMEMNRKLYLLCQEYIQCYGVFNCLINIDGLEEESLKLFRLTKERMEQLETEFVKIIVNTEVGKNE